LFELHLVGQDAILPYFLQPTNWRGKMLSYRSSLYSAENWARCHLALQELLLEEACHDRFCPAVRKRLASGL